MAGEALNGTARTNKKEGASDSTAKAGAQLHMR
jgi:hypothetical protein